MTPKLHFRTPDGEFRAVDLGAIEDSMVIGRDREVAAIVIPDSQVSRGHCEICNTPDGLVLADLGSRNGTWLNGHSIQRELLHSNDEIVVGGTTIRISGGGTSEQLAYQLLGQVVSGFKFEEIMGQGSYGTVYRGHQVALHREVAIKVLDPEHARDPEKLESFMLEARNAGRLNHPNVVQVHDVVNDGNANFLVMELMTGGSMSDKLRIDGPVDEDVACGILIDIGHALAYAEVQRLVHRDVKPDNILVNAEGIFKLADLGIAAPISDDGLARQSRAFGSAHYVAPEQARGGAIDGRADIYGLGASLYQLISGQPMFEGSSREVVTAHLHQNPTPLADLRPEFSSAITTLVMQMISKDLDQRPSTGNELAQRAQEIINGLDDPTASAGSSGDPGKVRRRRRRRRRR